MRAWLPCGQQSLHPRLIEPQKPSADRMGQVLSLMDPNPLRNPWRIGNFLPKQRGTRYNVYESLQP